MSDYKEPSKLTKEKYDLFVMYYLESFNAAQAAIKSGYSEKTARQQGNRLLTNVYIKEKLASEMKRLRDRFAEEGSRSFARLLDMLIQIEEKLNRHNEAMANIEALEKDAEEVYLQRKLVDHEMKSLQESADVLDGRKKEHRDNKRDLLNRIAELNEDFFNLSCEISAKNGLIQIEKKWLVYPKDWEKTMTLKMNILKDLLDRGGFKPLEKIEHSGSVQTPGVNPNLNSLTKEELEALVKFGQSNAASSG